MRRFCVLAREQHEWLVQAAIENAVANRYVEDSSTLRATWGLSIRGLTEALCAAAEQPADALALDPAVTGRADSVTEFAVHEARLHRKRGVSSALFLGLLKAGYRQAYVTLASRMPGDESERREAAEFVRRVFDLFEVAFIAEWSRHTDGSLLAELQEANRRITNEKNRLLTVLESTPSPVVLIDESDRIAYRNHVASELFWDETVPGESYYGASPPSGPQNDGVDQAALPPAMRPLLHGDRAGERELQTRRGPRVFDVRRQKMLDVSGKLTGCVLILEDVTARHEAQAELVRYRDDLEEVVLERSGQLERKNMALAELIDQFKRDKMRMQRKLAAGVEEMVHPLLCRLRERAEPTDVALIDILTRSINQLTVSDEATADTRNYGLSKREAEVANLVRGGMTSKEISRLLNISVRGVESHRRNIRKKLGLRSRNDDLGKRIEDLLGGGPS